MTINLTVATDSGSIAIKLGLGHRMYLLGPNGSGKSSLVHRFITQHHAVARRISAHRQTWFTSDSLDMTAQAKRQSEKNIQSKDAQPDSRWKDDMAAQRPNIAVYDLIDAENVRAREIAALVTTGDVQSAVAKSKSPAPVNSINELMRLSGMPIELEVKENERVLARRNSSDQYSIAELSDGERNALLMAASILTAPKESLILVDEPERHLHRSIVTPLLHHLFERRTDCYFVISTHEVLLAADDPRAQVLLLRGCIYNGRQATAWSADLLKADSEIPEEIRREILGARRKLLFVEGTHDSLDKALYAVLYPDITVIPKGNCREVEQAVDAVRETQAVHWAQPFGIVDGDGKSEEDIAALYDSGIVATEWYSVESVYYHPDVLAGIARRVAALDDSDPDARFKRATDAVLSGSASRREHLCKRVAKQRVREAIFGSLPGKELPDRLEIKVPVADILHAEHAAFDRAVESGDAASLIKRYPLRESPALSDASKALGFQSRTAYEAAVVKAVSEASEVREAVEKLMSQLSSLVRRPDDDVEQAAAAYSATSNG
ncbi:MAG: AAA family ATPase [Planctomycetaceae bacterium]|nr:AAA family ATPase [Planctomycetaceae bacterium]